MRFFSLIFAAAYSIAVAAHAGSFDPKTVPATAAWVVHLDLQRVAQSPLAELLKGTNAPLNVQAFLERYRRNLGLEPLRDIEQATLLGLGGVPANGAVIIAGRFKYDQIVNHLAGQPSYRNEQDGKNMVHQWNDQRSNTLYLCHLSSNRLVMATSLELLKQTIATLEGRAPSLEREGNLLVPGAMDALVSGAGRQEALPLKISAGCRYYHFAVKTLPDDTLDATAVIAMPDAKTASDSEKIIMGLAFSFALTNAKDPAAISLLQYLRVKADRDMLKVSFACPIPTALTLLCAMSHTKH